MSRANEYHGAYAGEVVEGTEAQPHYTDEELREQLAEVPEMLQIAQAELDPSNEELNNKSSDELTPEDLAIYRQYLEVHGSDSWITTGGPIHACLPQGPMVALCGQAVVWVDPEYEWPRTRYVVDQGDGMIPFVEEPCDACAEEIHKLQTGIGARIRRMFR